LILPNVKYWALLSVCQIQMEASCLYLAKFSEHAKNDGTIYIKRGWYNT